MHTIQICDRCKKPSRSSLSHLTIGTFVKAALCRECEGAIEELIKVELARVPLPDALKPYLTE